jgi:hypothetical protein
MPTQTVYDDNFGEEKWLIILEKMYIKVNYRWIKFLVER